MKTPNSVKEPEAWAFFIREARNMENTDIAHLGKYRIPVPDKSGRFIYRDSPESLWVGFILEWYKPSLDSPSVYGKIQYITQTFKG